MGAAQVKDYKIEYHYDKEHFRSLLSTRKIFEIVDTVKEQLSELFEIRNPESRYSRDQSKAIRHFINTLVKKTSIEEFGTWFLFPKSKILVHFLPEELHQELRTARNRNLITKKEQETFYNFPVGIAGLSIGSHAAFTITMMGGGKYLTLADPDILSASNLNRVRYNFSDVGKKKTLLAADGLSKMNPFAQLTIHDHGIQDHNISEFFNGARQIGVLVEEVDNLELKFKLRFKAKEMGIPVVMATDNGDNIIVDIERYDIEPRLPIFNGLVGDLTIKDYNEIPKDVLKSLIGNIVGIDHVTDSVLLSLAEVGKTLYSWPQLGDAANLSGSVIAYLVRVLSSSNNESLKSGKYSVRIDSLFS